MKKVILTLGCFMFVVSVCFAQNNAFNPQNSNRNISFEAGIYAATKGDLLSEGSVYSLNYTTFNYTGLGFGVGGSYVDAMDNDISAIQLPVSIKWRTPLPRKRTWDEQLVSAAYATAQSSSFNASNILMSMLSFRFAFMAGLTPACIVGNGSYNEVADSYYGRYSEGVSVANRFALSADLGLSLSCRIWRFNIDITPQYHYWLTDNFDYSTTLEALSGTNVPRSYVSLQAGVSFMF